VNTTAGQTVLLATAVLLPIWGCGHDLTPLGEPPGSATVLTGGSWASMIYLARTDAGIVAIDLGGDGDGTAIRNGLRALGASPDDVVAVFLTHSHRDHIAAWPVVQGARFHMASPEVPRFQGESRHGGILAGAADRLLPPSLPLPGALGITAFDRDTTFVFGADTLFAFHVPGHTPGSSAYLFRGVLFVGDAVTWTPPVGFHGARRVFSDDVRLNRASVVQLWDRVAGLPVRWLCTAHGRCADWTEDLRRRALR